MSAWSVAGMWRPEAETCLGAERLSGVRIAARLQVQDAPGRHLPPRGKDGRIIAGVRAADHRQRDRPTGEGLPRLPPSPWSWIRSSLVEISGPRRRPPRTTDFLKSCDEANPMNCRKAPELRGHQALVLHQQADPTPARTSAESCR